MFKQYIPILILFLFVYSLSCLQGAAQSPCTLGFSGEVRDKDTQEILPYVQIQLANTQKGAISDSLGRFSFDALCAGAHVFDFHHIGYKTLHVDVLLDVFLVRSLDTVVYMSIDPVLLKTVVVEGAHQEVPRSVPSAGLDKKDLLEAPNKSLAALLEVIPGVSALYSGSGISKPVIQGLYGIRVAILHHEILQEDQQWGIEHMPNIDPHMAKGIQVVKGVGLLRYGMGALGGIITLESERLPYETTR